MNMIAKLKAIPESDCDCDSSEAFPIMPSDAIGYLAVAAFALDSRGLVSFWNNACERLTGYSASEMIGTSNHWRAFYSEQRPTLADLLLQDRASDVDRLYVKNDNPGADNYFSAENWCELPRTGHRRFLVMDAAAVFDDRGCARAVIQTVRDITSLKEAEVRLERLATLDALTELANRRTFDDMLDRHWSQAKRKGQSLALLMVDVDHFKTFNDSYGHPEGDECLRKVAGAMAAEMRGTDILARYGGEEFAVILPNQDAFGAVQVAERLRAAVEQLALPNKKTAWGQVTISIGAAAVTPSGHLGPNSLLAAADSALYFAKHLGRNRVETH